MQSEKATVKEKAMVTVKEMERETAMARGMELALVMEKECLADPVPRIWSACFGFRPWRVQ